MRLSCYEVFALSTGAVYALVIVNNGQEGLGEEYILKLSGTI